VATVTKEAVTVIGVVTAIAAAMVAVGETVVTADDGVTVMAVEEAEGHLSPLTRPAIIIDGPISARGDPGDVQQLRLRDPLQLPQINPCRTELSATMAKWLDT
jgi:hypothetical protein